MKLNADFTQQHLAPFKSHIHTMPPAQTWLKMTAAGIGICIGGPALVQYLRPSDKELFDRYSPDIQQRSLEEGPRRAQEFDDYVNRLKEWSKSDKSIWIAAQEQHRQKQETAQAQAQQAQGTSESERNAAAQREEMRKELLGSGK
ncbi:hypothetical protein PHISP_02014 [Aspergillus sp. HF37]|nr:hypothetical protein PHISP_02014 [Aspergillus sp. HF37]